MPAVVRPPRLGFDSQRPKASSNNEHLDRSRRRGSGRSNPICPKMASKPEAAVTRYARQAKRPFGLRAGDGFFQNREHIRDRTLERVGCDRRSDLEIDFKEMQKDAMLAEALPFFRFKLSDKSFVILLMRHRNGGTTRATSCSDSRIHSLNVSKAARRRKPDPGWPCHLGRNL